MKSLRTWLASALVLPILFVYAACGGSSSSSGSFDGDANLQINLTDAPGDYLSVLVTITGIYAIVDQSAPLRLDFADFSSPAIVDQTPSSVTVDLIQLADEQPIAFALGDLPAGDLNQIRLIVSEASLTAFEDEVGIDGNDDGIIEHVEATYPVKVPSGAQSGIKLNPRDVEIESRSLTSLTLDFDADKSIVQLGGAGSANRDFDFILKPVIFIVEAVGTVPVDAETAAIGFSFPTAVEVAEDVGPASVIGEGDVLVASAGAGTLKNTVVAVDVYEIADPVDASTLVPFASDDDIILGEPLVNSPSGLAQFLDLVWISNAASVTGLYNAGTVAELYTSGDFRTGYIGNLPPTESVAGLVETSGLEFGGFAPNRSLAGEDLVIYQTNANGSITGILVSDELIFDVVPAVTFSEPTDLAFVPSATPLQTGDSAGTVLGTLFVTDAATNEVGVVRLTTTGGLVGDSETRIAGQLLQVLTYPFLSEPIGIAYSQTSDRLFIANRGNGTIIVIKPDGTEVATFDTGFGANSLNGIDAVPDGTGDIVFVTNTAGNDDASVDDPDTALNTLERIIIPFDN